MQKQNPSATLPAVTTVVDTLREEILKRNEAGWLIGLEEDIQERMGVSRPTLRQALRVLESEGLLEVRRGVHGGLYGCVPNSDSVARTASVYLRSRGTTAFDLMIAQSAIFGSMMWLAVNSPERESVKEWLSACDAQGEYTPRRALETSLEFMRRVASLANNEALKLFEEVMYELARGPYDTNIFSNPERRAHALTYLRRLAEAIGAGDMGTAIEEIEKNTQIVLKWLSDSEGKK